MFKLDLEKAEEPEIKLLTSAGSSRKQESSRKKYLILLYWRHQSIWRCGSQQAGKFLKRWEYQTTLPASWKICMQAKKQKLELDMEQWAGSKLGKEYIKPVYCHPAYLMYMQITSWEMLNCMEHKPGIKIAGGNINNFGMQMTPPLWQKAKKH